MTSPHSRTWIKVISAPTLGLVRAQWDALSSGYDMVEWRVDCLQEMDEIAMAAICGASSVPVMLTWRTVAHGGHAPDDHDVYVDTLFRLAKLAPDYLDCQAPLSAKTLAQLQACAPQTRLICSQHFLHGPPTCWSAVLAAMRHPAVYAYKMVLGDVSTLDALAQLSWLRAYAGTERLIMHAMTHDFSRILAPIFGSHFVYFSADHIPGALTVEAANQLYRMAQHHDKTRIYALLGDPVAQSIGHVFHNRAFALQHQDAVYVKIPVPLAHWQACWAHLSSWTNLMGCSVTAPLKTVMATIAMPCTPMRAVNTLVRDPQASLWYGYQTDGEGAWSVLDASYKLSRVLLIGGGGAIRAIAQSAVRRGHAVSVLQRNSAAFRDWYAAQNVEVLHDLSVGDHGFEVVFYGLPPTVPVPKTWSSWLLRWPKPPEIIMDLSYGSLSSWQQWVQAHWPSVPCLDGLAMFEAQAQLQQQRWSVT